MGRELYQTCATFRSSVQELDAIHTKAAGYSLIERYGLFGSTSTPDPLGDVWPIAVTLPALTILQLALCDTLAAIGIKPDVVIGHSAGETAVVYASGAGSKAMTVELAIARGKAMALLEAEQGTMAAVSCSPRDAQTIIAEVVEELGPGALEVGCFNTPDAITLSGLGTHIDLAVAKAEARGIFARRLRTRIPVHSPMMHLCEGEYRRLVGDVFAKYDVTPPTVETYSTKLGDRFASAFDSDYFWDGTLGPVHFTNAMNALAASHPNATYVELSPHPVLSSYISSFAGKDATVTCPLKRAKKTEQTIEVPTFLETIGKVIVAGHNAVDFDVLYGGFESKQDVPLDYPFAKKIVPYATPSPIITRQLQHRNGPMNYPQLQINAKSHPALADHVIKEEPIMPAAGYMEMVWYLCPSVQNGIDYSALLRLWNLVHTSYGTWSLSLSSHSLQSDRRLSIFNWTDTNGL